MRGATNNMDELSLLIWGATFGVIGFSYFAYGRRQHTMMPVLAGISLIIFPYFVSSVPMLLGIGAILLLLPYFLKV